MATPGTPSRLTSAEVQTMLTVTSMLARSLKVSDHTVGLSREGLERIGRMFPLQHEFLIGAPRGVRPL